MRRCSYVYAHGVRCERTARRGHTTCDRHYTAGIPMVQKRMAMKQKRRSASGTNRKESQQ
jgi:hypothetical protein